jgi:hypothetical protein
MSQQRRRKCRHCGALFRPDPRNIRHQRFCSKPPCRRASKAASQRRWLAKADNRDYFRGAENVERVRAWRSDHPGYWRRSSPSTGSALQEHSLTQATDNHNESASLMNATLQELSRAQPLVLMGLIAQLTGAALQEDIVLASRRLQHLANDILNASPERAPRERAP